MSVKYLQTKKGMERLLKNLKVARKRRQMTQADMAERCGVSLATYKRLEAGDDGVAMGTLLTALTVAGVLDLAVEATMPEKDVMGVSMEVSRLPERIRSPATPKF